MESSLRADQKDFDTLVHSFIITDRHARPQFKKHLHPRMDLGIFSLESRSSLWPNWGMALYSAIV